jgi:hypothetical protein
MKTIEDFNPEQQNRLKSQNQLRILKAKQKMQKELAKKELEKE